MKIFEKAKFYPGDLIVINKGRYEGFLGEVYDFCTKNIVVLFVGEQIKGKLIVALTNDVDKIQDTSMFAMTLGVEFEEPVKKKEKT